MRQDTRTPRSISRCCIEVPHVSRIARDMASAPMPAQLPWQDQDQQPPWQDLHFINKIRTSALLKIVGLNQVDTALSVRPGRKKYFATENLSASTAVAIFSPTAAILANIAPTNPLIPTVGWQTNLNAKLRELSAAYSLFSTHFPNPQVMVLAAEKPSGELTSPETLLKANWFLQSVLKVPYGNIYLKSFPLGSVQSQRGETSLVIWWHGSGEMPVVIVNNTFAYVDDGKNNAEAQARVEHQPQPALETNT